MGENDATAIIIKNNKNEVLLQKKTLDYLPSPGLWGMFGGAIEQNETPERAIIRETKEELNITLTHFSLLKVFKNTPDKFKKYKKLYVFKTTFSGNISEFSIGEGAGIAFFGKKELDKLNTQEETKKVLIEFFNSEKFI